MMSLLTLEQRAALKAKAAPHRQTLAQSLASVTSSPRTGLPAKIRWTKLLEDFRTMLPDTDRPNTLLALVREGTWLEMRGQLPAGQSVERITQAAYDNGFIGLHGLSRITDTVACTVPWARDHHMWGDGNAGRSTPTKPNTSLVHPPSCTPSRVQRFIDDIHTSSLPPSAKRQLYIAATIQIQHPDWTNLVMAARPTGKAAKIDKQYVGGNWRKAEKLGFIGYNPGVDYETAKALGVDSKSSEITLNLDIYSDEPVDHPLVNLDDYADRVAEFRGYIKYRQRALKDERQAYLRAEDTSTATTPQEPVQRASAESIALLKALLNGES